MNGKTVHLVQRAVPSLIYQNRNSGNSETTQPQETAHQANSNVHNVFHQLMGGINEANGTPTTVKQKKNKKKFNFFI